MAAPLILGRTFKQAHAFARDVLGLSFGHYRVVNSPGTIKAVRNTKLYLLEDWDKRPDRFSMKTAMRYCRNEIIDTTVEAPIVDDRGELTERQLEVAYRYNRLIGTISSTPVVVHESQEAAKAASLAEATDFFITSGVMSPEGFTTSEPTPEPEVAEEKPKRGRRRSRCKTCGNLHYKEDPCPPSEDA